MSRRGWLVVLCACLAALIVIPTRWMLSYTHASGVGHLSLSAPSPAPPARSAVTPSIIGVHRAVLRPQSSAVARSPVDLMIPIIGVTAAVDNVGVTPNGTVAIPHDADHVGWFRFGPAPGEPQGSAVIVGHRDSRTQGRGALYKIGVLELGDELRVRLSSGAVLRYRVLERRLYDKQGLPWDRFFTTQGPARLTVITCGGDFIASRGSYQDNLIITAVPA